MTLVRKLTNFFSSKKSNIQNVDQDVLLQTKFHITIVDFQDNVESSSGENTAKILQSMSDFEICFYDEPFNKSFLNLESRTLFDLIDKGEDLIERTQADVLIWGRREDDKIRLNFQTAKQYEKDNDAFVSLLDSLYLPAELFNNPSEFPSAVKTLLHAAIISALNPSDNSTKIHRKYLLKKDIALLSSDNSAKQLAVRYMPFIMNFLGIIYLSCTYDSNSASDFKITQNLFATAIKHQDLIDSPLHLGCIYFHLGQLNDCAREYLNKNPNHFFKEAVNSYHQAQRYLGKYTYPYDYGIISYRLSQLFFKYWKLKEDTQALRDATSQLREVEKIFSVAQFPEFWAEVQGELGYLLSILGNMTQNVDICLAAIDCYQNQQKIFTEKREPLTWASAQEHIGNLHYKIGTEHNSRDHLEDALECFHDALYIYENINQNDKIKQLLIAINKTNGELKGI